MTDKTVDISLVIFILLPAQLWLMWAEIKIAIDGTNNALHFLDLKN